MPNVMMYKTDGTQAGEIKLVDEVFGAEVNANAIHQVIVAQLAALRHGTQSALGRSEVRGGGIKPWRQKGTGGPGRVPSALPNGQRAAWYSPPSPVPMP